MSENNIIYCPNEIKCEADGDISSCQVSDNPQNIWFVTSNWSWDPNIKGIYRFNSSNPFPFSGVITKLKSIFKNKKLIEGFGTCRYTIIDTLGNEKDITAQENRVFFTALLGSETKWEVVNNNDNTFSIQNCISNDPKLCPLVLVPTLTYETKNNDWAYFQYENRPITYADHLFYFDLISMCNEPSSCKFSIMKEDPDNRGKHILTGSVTVDISILNEINIINLETDPNSHCTLKKREPFNLIYCDPNKN